eukprot:6482439-Amphidinium_carterae.1
MNTLDNAGAPELASEDVKQSTPKVPQHGEMGNEGARIGDARRRDMKTPVGVWETAPVGEQSMPEGVSFW